MSATRFSHQILLLYSLRSLVIVLKGEHSCHVQHLKLVKKLFFLQHSVHWNKVLSSFRDVKIICSQFFWVPARNILPAKTTKETCCSIHLSTASCLCLKTFYYSITWEKLGSHDDDDEKIITMLLKNCHKCTSSVWMNINCIDKVVIISGCSKNSFTLCKGHYRKRNSAAWNRESVLFYKEVLRVLDIPYRNSVWAPLVIQYTTVYNHVPPRFYVSDDVQGSLLQNVQILWSWGM